MHALIFESHTVTLLVERLGSACPTARLDAARTLGRLGGEAKPALPVLAEMLLDEQLQMVTPVGAAIDAILAELLREQAA